MNTNRRAVYSVDCSCRVVSVHNGLWQLQQHDGSKGSKEYDPWFKHGAPTDRNDAIKTMGE